MIVTLRLLSILSLVSSTESECSSTSYYRNCWIRRFPGLHVDAEESQRRGAQLLQLYRGDSAQNCSRACCLTSNCEFQPQNFPIVYHLSKQLRLETAHDIKIDDKNLIPYIILALRFL